MVKKEEIVWILLRLALGFTFLWAFLDKLFGKRFRSSLSLIKKNL